VIVLLKFIGSGSNGAPVPQVVGQTLNTAQQTIRSAGFRVGRETPQASQTDPKNTVISQSPQFGGNATKNTAINLVYSTGPTAPATVNVPDVTGQTVPTATQTLQNAGFKVGAVQRQQQAGTQPNTVLSQSPTGGTPAKKGSTVTLTATPTEPTVPQDVIGKTVAAATAELTQLGYNVQTTPVSGNGQPNTVSQVTPQPGTPLAPGSTITLFFIQQPQQSPPPSPSTSPSPNPNPTSPGPGGNPGG